MRLRRPIPIGLLIALLTASCGGDPDPVSEPPTEPPEAPTLTAVIELDRTEGPLPLVVQFDSAASITPHEITEAQWSFGEDGQTALGLTASYTYLTSGPHTVTLTLTDVEGGTDATTATVDVHPPNCPAVLGSYVMGQLEHPQLDRASGFAASFAHPGLLWSHNDGDDPARLFAIEPDGRHVAEFGVPDATNSDWEDITSGVDPTSGLPTIYVADAGDDAENRTEIAVYMIAEPSPEALAEADADGTGLGWTSMTVVYPDEAVLDSEVFLFDPQTGALFLVSRDPETGATSLFRKPAPHLPATTEELEFVRALPLFDDAGPARGGTVSPLGDRIVLRTSDAAFLWMRDVGASFEAALDGEACPLPAPEPGDSIEFAHDGSGLFATARAASAAVEFIAFVEPPVPCDGLEARFSVDPPFGHQVPVDVAFTVDETCIPEGVASVEWTLDGETTDELAPSVSFSRSGEVAIALTVVDGAGASATTSGTLQLAPAACPAPAEVEVWGTVESDEIDEASGLAASTRNPGVLWVHNDSGDTARLFAMTTAGVHLGIWTLPDDARDYEAMTYGEDATLGQEAIYVGDVGDNAEERESVTIYVVPEPDVDVDAPPVDVDLEDIAALQLTYPGGEAHNCETLMRDPETGDLYLWTKNGTNTAVFRKAAPHVAGSFELEWVADLDLRAPPYEGSSLATGGDIGPTGRRVVLRTYTDAWLWIREEGQSLADMLATARACDVNAPSEPQGETAAFAADGAGYITVSEGDAQPIHYTPLTP